MDNSNFRKVSSNAEVLCEEPYCKFNFYDVVLPVADAAEMFMSRECGVFCLFMSIYMIE